MARPLRIEFEDALYHLTARGNRREAIFGGDADREHFLALLGRSLARCEVELHAYVLLPNHFHLLARTRRANLSRWMHWLMVAYTVWFNRRHDNVGHLFQGRYKSLLVEGGSYLLELSRYIHLNPVRGRRLGAGDPQARRERLRSYRWSSYRGYAGLERRAAMVSEELVLGEMGARSARAGRLRYRRFVEKGLVREIENLVAAAQWQAVLGSETFLQRVKDRMQAHRGKRREVTALRRGTTGPNVRAVIAPHRRALQSAMRAAVGWPAVRAGTAECGDVGGVAAWGVKLTADRRDVRRHGLRRGGAEDQAHGRQPVPASCGKKAVEGMSKYLGRVAQKRDR